MRFIQAAVAAVIVLSASFEAAAQPCAQTWLRQFPSADVNNTVYRMAYSPLPSINGLLVTGNFSQGGPVIGSLLVWGASGFTPFAGPTVLSSQRDLAVFDFDGPGPEEPQLVVAGRFSLPTGAAVARWTGSQWLPVSNFFGGSVTIWSLAVFDSGTGPQLYAGADTGFYRWNGATWDQLTNNSSIMAMAVFDEDGPGGAPPALFMPGSGDPGVEVIAKWNGSSFSPVGSGLGTGEGLYSLHVADLDGNGPALYAGGTFNVAHGAPANRIAKWNGTTWSALGTGVSAGSANWTNVLAITDVDEDGNGPLPRSLIIGGDFSVAGGSPSLNTARWRTGSWSPLSGAFNGQVWCLGVNQESGQSVVCAGGEFTAPGSHMVRLVDSAWMPMSNGANAAVRALASVDLGGGAQLWAGGDFTTVAGGSMPAGAVATWDGRHWNNLAGGIVGSVQALAGYDAGSGIQVYAGGAFGQVGGINATNVATLSNGVWSTLNGGTPGLIHAAVMFDDDGPGPTPPALYVAGEFTSIGGQSISGLARWDGTSWFAVGGGLSGSGRYVFDMLVWDDGTGPALYIGGDFFQAGGVNAYAVAKWNGSTWQGLAGGVGSTSYNVVRKLTLYDDGTGSALYAGGRFNQMGGAPTGKVAKWNGSAWSSVGPTNWTGGLPDVWGFAAFNDGSGQALYACGKFTGIGSTPALNLARWRGGAWSSIGDVGQSTGNTVRALAVFDDGSGPALYVTGDFVLAGGVGAQYIARWNGSAWSPVGDPNFPVNGQGWDLQVYNDGSGPALYMGGTMTTQMGSGMNSVGMIRWTGAGWQAGPNVGGGTQTVQYLSTYDSGTGPTLLISGNFTVAGRDTATNIARWDGAAWHAMGTALNEVHAMTVFDDGSGPVLYVGGGFTSIAGVPANRIAKWNGSSWSALGTGLNQGVNALVVFDDGTGPALYAGGSFTTAGGVAAERLARWRNGVWSRIPAARPCNGTVRALAVFSDLSGPALYIGGDFTSICEAGGGNWPYLVRWNGAAWSQVAAAPDARVLALAALTDADGAQLFVGGDFTHIGALATNHIARWDGQAWSDMGSGVNGAVLTLTAFEDQIGAAIYAGGGFTLTGGTSNVDIGRWGCPGGDQLADCYANCDGSVVPPVLNVLDFACFLNGFAAGHLYANCDGSVVPPVLNVLDFACFLNRFAAGCP